MMTDLRNPDIYMLIKGLGSELLGFRLDFVPSVLTLLARSRPRIISEEWNRMSRLHSRT